MQLQRSNLLLRWAYLLEHGIPSKTDLCTVFWGSVLFTPLKLAAVGSAIALPIVFLYLLIRDFGWRGTLLFFATLTAAIGVLASGIGGAVYAIRSAPVKQIKKNYCPIIEVKD